MLFAVLWGEREQKRPPESGRPWVCRLNVRLSAENGEFLGQDAFLSAEAVEVYTLRQARCIKADLVVEIGLCLSVEEFRNAGSVQVQDFKHNG